MPGNWHVPFGKGPSEKDPNHGHLVGGLLHHTWEGWVYLATVIDCYSKAVVGWAVADHMRTELVTDAINMAARNIRIPKNAIFHSDRGSQYMSYEYED
jgi:transposase InsO family protein